MKEEKINIITEPQETDNNSLSVVEARVSKPLEYNKIYLGDSFELIERVPAKTVDLILEDMPYNTTACEWDVKIDLELYWKTRLRILKPTGAIVLTASQPFTSMLVTSNVKYFRDEWIWEKDRATRHLDANIRPLKAHENVLVFGLQLPIYNPQKINNYKPANKQGKTLGNLPELLRGGLIPSVKYGQTDRYPRTIQKFYVPNGDERGLHPTQKPVGLFEYLIRTYTNEGDLVFDGFGGSGTTAVACHKSKRNFIVIEKEKKYFDLATRRLDNERKQLSLLY